MALLNIEFLSYGEKGLMFFIFKQLNLAFIRGYRNGL